jgi:uncharacterized protein YkwD
LSIRATGPVAHQHRATGAGLGQNVGYGPTVASLQHAFLHSRGHRANMFYRYASRIGVGAWCDGRGTLWVAVNFMQAR